MSGSMGAKPGQFEEKRALLILSMAKGMGPIRARLLLDKWKDARTAVARSAEESGAGEKVPPWIRSLSSPRTIQAAEAVHALTSRLKLDLLGWGLPGYPSCLQVIPDAPLVLFKRGELAIGEIPATVAIVGARNPTPYGRRMTEELAGGLAAAGVVVVSGLARGIDSHAHLAALKAGGKTIAVLAGGLDKIYPPEREKMAEEICANGLLLAEMPPGTCLTPGLFPRRNRIISGLVNLVVVVEAGVKSGALITARLALDQGRDVAAVPGPVHAPLSTGPLNLIRDGAALADGVDTIISLLPPTGTKAPSPKETPHGPAPSVEATSLLRALSRTGGDPEAVALEMDLDIGQVLALITDLEIQGRIRREAAGIYLPA